MASDQMIFKNEERSARRPKDPEVKDDWYIACRSEELGSKPIATSLYDRPIALFRAADGSPGALVDRCPHRNAPLSEGSIVNDLLQCQYHGWRFDVQGVCRFAAGISEGSISNACHAESYSVREQQGYVWIYASPGSTPVREPFSFPSQEGHTSGKEVLEAEGSLHQVAENALDVPHTAYLHGGLFRNRKARPQGIDVEVRFGAEGVEAEYIGEQRPSGFAGRILAPGGGRVRHVDRFILPSITQVDYRVGNRTHLCVTVAMTPVSQALTRLYVVVSYKLPLPGWMIRPFLRPLFLRIFHQDAEALRKQTANIQRFGEAKFSSTDADVMGKEILRLLNMASRNDRPKSTHGKSRTLRLIV